MIEYLQLYSYYVKMIITDVNIRHVEEEGILKAYCSITMDDCFVMHNVKIIDGDQGLFIGMPSRRTESGEFKDVCHPIKQELRTYIQERVLEKYHKVLDLSL